MSKARSLADRAGDLFRKAEVEARAPAPSLANALKFLRTNAAGTGREEAALDLGIKRSARTANLVLTKADQGKHIDITSGTFTQTFDAAATLGDGWFCYLRNSGTGDVTLDPTGSETIDGLASFISYPGEVRLIQCDGISLRSIVIAPFLKTFIASDNFIKPPGYSKFQGMIWAGGAGGQKVNSSSVQGGGGGGSFPFDIPASILSASSPVIVGSGGAPSTTNGVQYAGGNSSFGGITVKGGDQNYGGSVYVTDRSGNLFMYQQNDAFGFPQSNTQNTIYGGLSVGAANEGGTIYGGACGGMVGSNLLKAPGRSIFGGGGGIASFAGNGTDGQAPGGGGGATQTGAQSGAGGRGQVEIRGVA